MVAWLLDRGGRWMAVNGDDAIESAQRADCIASAGALLGFEVEALVTKFQAVSDADWGVLRLGELPSKESRDDPLRQISFAVELKPTWFLHRHGFVEVK